MIKMDNMNHMSLIKNSDSGDLSSKVNFMGLVLKKGKTTNMKAFMSMVRSPRVN